MKTGLLILAVFGYAQTASAAKAIMEGIAATGNTVFVDTTNIRLGIGTAAPNQVLDVRSAGTTRMGIVDTLDAVTFNLSAQSGGGYIYTQTNSPLNFATNNASSQMTLGTNGFLGLGTINPAQRLHVSSGTVLIDGNTPALNITGIGSTVNPILVGVSTFVVQSGGNVGIGTASPGKNLTIGGSSNGEMSFLDNTSTARGFVGTPTWSSSYIAMQNASITESAVNLAIAQDSVGNTIINAASGQSLSFRNNNQTGMTMDLNRNIGIGTTGPCSTCTLHVNGGIASNGTVQLVTLKFNDGTSQTTASTSAGSSTTLDGSSFTGNFTNSTHGVCVSTLTLTTTGSKVNVWFNGTGFSNGAFTSVQTSFLEDGQFVAPWSTSVPAAYVVSPAAAGAGATHVGFNVVIRAPSAAAHSYCLTRACNSGNTCTLEETATVSQFGIQEVK